MSKGSNYTEPARMQRRTVRRGGKLNRLCRYRYHRIDTLLLHSYTKLLSISEAQTVVEILDEDAREHQALHCAFLNSIVHYVASHFWWVPLVNKGKLHGENAQLRKSTCGKLVVTFKTPMWKSPEPASPSGTVGFFFFGDTGFSACSLGEKNTCNVFLSQSTITAKLCQVSSRNGVL